MMKRFNCSLAVVLSAVCPAFAFADPPQDLIFTQQGSLPIILLAGHGGSEKPSDIGLARADDDPDDVLLNDFRTDLLTNKAASDLANLLGGDVYFVVNDISRLYLDLNRDKTIAGTIGNAAFEDPDAEAYYDYYHNTISTYIAEVLANHGGGILIDVHGQGAAPSTVFRGTRNGETVTHMLSTFGEAALTGPNSIFGQLDTLGYDVDPNNNELIANDPEDTYIGGYSVDTYGSHNVGGIDAIQIEFGSALRFSPNATAWEDSGADLAVAIAAYYNTYLVPEPTSLALLCLGGFLLVRRRR